MIEIGKKYRTTGGTKVRRILCVDRESDTGFSVVAEMEGQVLAWNECRRPTPEELKGVV